MLVKAVEETTVEAVAGPRVGLSDEAALRRVVREHGGEIHAFARRAVRDPALADEIAQDVFVRAWNARDQYDPTRGTLRGWLYGIARNRIIDSQRSRMARPQLVPVSDQQPEPGEATEDVLRQMTIAAALDRLPDDRRALVEQVYLEGRTPTEVAAATGVKPGTVRRRLHDALAVLRRHAEEDHR
jgi:RNA polymerase sigma-70 factor, ECF subfamily